MSELLKNGKKHQEIIPVTTMKPHQLTIESLSSGKIKTTDDFKAIRALIDADIKLRNPELRGYCLRIEGITAKSNDNTNWRIKCYYRPVIKQYERDRNLEAPSQES